MSLVEQIKKFASGATYITFHYEAVEDNKIEDLISLIHSLGVKSKVLLNSATKQICRSIDFIRIYYLLCYLTYNCFSLLFFATDEVDTRWK